MAKKIDVKQLLLQKGERIGMGVALVVSLVLIGLGALSAMSSDSPGTTVQFIQDKANQINHKLINDPGTVVPPPQIGALADKPVPLPEFITKVDHFVDSGVGDKKWINPTVVSPVEYEKPIVVPAQVKNYMLSFGRDRVMVGVLVAKEVGKGAALNADPRMQRWLEQMKQWQNAQQNIKGGVGGPWPGMQGVQAVAADGQPVREEYDLKMIPSDKLDPRTMIMAETIQPMRMVVIHASFPYKQQVGRFCAALGNKTVEELAANPDLLPKFGYSVRRRTLDAAGNVKDDWVEIDNEKMLEDVFRYAVDKEREDPLLQPVLFPGLVKARPLVTQRTAYPNVNLKTIQDSLRDYHAKTAKAPEAKALSPIEARFMRTGGPNTDIADFEVKPKQDRPPPQPIGRDGPAKEFILVDHCLLRFTDTTVKPGESYQYQFMVKVVNPNFGKTDVVAYPELAKIRDISGQWWPEEGITAALPREQFIYAVELDRAAIDEKEKRDAKLKGDKEVTYIQVHKWFETARTNPENRNSEVPLGDWAIGEVPVRRGEQIGRIEYVEVPIWFETRREFGLPVQSAPAKSVGIIRPPTAPKGIPIDFATPDILVDWEGGRIETNIRINEKQTKLVREDANLELLVLSPDGKLLVRSSRADALDKEREKRLADFKKWVEEVRVLGKKSGGTSPFKK